MPLVRIDLRRGKSTPYRSAISQVVYDAMASVLNVPANDRFQVITEHDPDGLIYDPKYLGIERTDDIVIIQITLNQGRTLDQKKAFYRAVADGLAKSPGVRQEDVFINLVEVLKENWSFGNGVAQYAT
jgi:4-oxalocrotonate tautomerase